MKDIRSIRKGYSIFVIDSMNPNEKSQKVKIISKKKDSSGMYDLVVEFENGKREKWYLEEEEKIFE